MVNLSYDNPVVHCKTKCPSEPERQRRPLMKQGLRWRSGSDLHCCLQGGDVPELPEVETVVRDLRPLLLGRRFTSILVSKKALRQKWSRAWEAQLLGKTVRRID